MKGKPILWTTSKKYLGILAKEYKEALRNSNKSGTHVVILEIRTAVIIGAFQGYVTHFCKISYVG